MNDRPATKLVYWPFLLVDVLFLGLAWAIFQYAHRPLELWAVYAIILCVAIGAWSFLTPFRLKLRLAENDNLSSTLEQIKTLQHVAEQVSSSTGLWDRVHEQSAKTAEAAKQVAQQMSDEARSFSDFLKKANDSEKAFLKLEVDKLKRTEADWMQVVVRILDNVYALHQGALQSRQQKVIEQIDRFQHTCVDAARRVGLAPFIGQPGEAVDPTKHEVMDGSGTKTGVIGQTVALGYQFQGQLVRRALVALQVEKPAAVEEAQHKAAAAVAEPEAEAGQANLL